MIMFKDTSFHSPSSCGRAAPAPKDRLTSHCEPVRRGEDLAPGMEGTSPAIRPVWGRWSLGVVEGAVQSEFIRQEPSR